MLIDLDLQAGVIHGFHPLDGKIELFLGLLIVLMVYRQLGKRYETSNLTFGVVCLDKDVECFLCDGLRLRKAFLLQKNRCHENHDASASMYIRQCTHHNKRFCHGLESPIKVAYALIDASEIRKRKPDSHAVAVLAMQIQTAL